MKKETQGFRDCFTKKKTKNNWCQILSRQIGEKNYFTIAYIRCLDGGWVLFNQDSSYLCFKDTAHLPNHIIPLRSLQNTYFSYTSAPVSFCRSLTFSDCQYLVCRRCVSQNLILFPQYHINVDFQTLKTDLILNPRKNVCHIKADTLKLPLINTRA